MKKDLNFEHKSVVHKYKFVDYLEKVLNQNIESYNNKIKLRIKQMKGLYESERENFLLEFMWLDGNSLNAFGKILDLFKF